MKPKPDPKPLFLERMGKLLGKEFQEYKKSLEKESPRYLRCNTIKISPEELKKRLEEKSWKIKQPLEEYPEIMMIENKLEPGELGRTKEHLLGYYYIQDLASMLPVIALQPKEKEFILDMCAAPGSKTTQIAAKMKNTGIILANDISLGRIKILASNLERCGATNTIITRKGGSSLCNKMKNANLKEVDKILLDAPCSGEGTLRTSPKTAKMWNINMIKRLSKIQKDLLSNAINILKPGGELVYSTCTHAPEENEEVIDFILKEFGDKVNIENIKLPVKCREGITEWDDKDYNNQVTKSCRIYPQDNDTEGFFIAKFRRVG